MIQYASTLHKDFELKKRKAVAWGLSQDAHIRLVTAPYRFDLIIDGGAKQTGLKNNFYGIPVHSPVILDEFQEHEIGIVVFSDAKQFGAEILLQISESGDFPTTLPYEQSFEVTASKMVSRISSAFFSSQQQPAMGFQNSRVLLCLPVLFKGGADRQLVLLALGLRKLGKEVWIVTASKDVKGTESWQLSLKNAGVHRIIAPDLRKTSVDSLSDGKSERLGLLPPRYLSFFNTIVSAIEKVRPGLAIGFLDNANISLGLAASQTGIPKVVLTGRSQAPIDVPNYTTMLDFDLMKALYQGFMQRVGWSFVCNSDSGCDSYRRWLALGESDARVINNAQFIEPFEHLALRKSLKLKEDAILVCGVMRLIDTKRPQIFIDLVTKARRYLPELHAIIVGDGPLLADIEDKIAFENASSFIHLLGTRENALPFMFESDLFLHTSEVEGTANVLLEAQSMGLPVFAFESDSTIKAVKHVPLYLAPEGNVHELGRLLIKNATRRVVNKLPEMGCEKDVIRMAREFMASQQEGAGNLPKPTQLIDNK